MPEHNPVGLIGLGLVGQGLIARLLAGGWSVVGFDLDASARDNAAAQGTQVAGSAAEVAQLCDRLLLSLPNSDIVRQVLWERGVAENLVPGSTVIDTTTGRAGDARENRRRLAEQGVHFVDATLSGSSAEIARGEATALVGDEEQGADYAPVLRAFASRIIYLGAPGAGCLAKLITNHVMGLNRAALAEGLALGLRAGLDGARLLEVLGSSAANSWVLGAKGDRMVTGDFSPASRISQHAKDVGLILDLAQELGAHVPLERVHRELLARCIDQGWGDLDNAAIIRAYLQAGNTERGTTEDE